MRISFLFNRHLRVALLISFGLLLLPLLPLPAVPGFALRLTLGERAQAVLASQRVRPDGLTELGFEFAYPELEEALEAIYGQPHGRPER